SFYERIHAPTLGTSWGAAGMIMGSIIIFTAGSGRVVLHEILIGVFVTITTPVTLMMLGRAALYRDRSELNPGIAPTGDADYLIEKDGVGRVEDRPIPATEGVPEQSAPTQAAEEPGR